MRIRAAALSVAAGAAVGASFSASAAVAGTLDRPKLRTTTVDWSVRFALFAPDKRPAVLPMLYVSFAALQVYDGYSTRQALGHGGIEANGSMQVVANHSAALWAVKAGMATGAVLIAERMWKENKVAAIAMMVAADGVAAVVAAHNASVLKQLR